MMATHFFKHQQAKELLHNKFVVILGDSNQRGMYKDLVQMLQRDDYLTRPQLKSKGEEVFENDRLLDGGMRGKMTNGTEYREVRQYSSDHHWVRFYFTTRVYSEYVGEILEELNNDPKPDLVIVNSCVWDVSRYGRKWRDGYLQNLSTFFEKLKAILPEESLIIWNMALPLSKSIVGGFLVPEIAEFGPMLRFDIVEANYWSATVASAYGLDVLDLHFHFRRSLQLRAQDGVHWNGVAHRHITCLLLAHAAQAWGVEMPPSLLPTGLNQSCANTNLALRDPRLLTRKAKNKGPPWQQRQRWVNFHQGPAPPWMAPSFYPANSGNVHFGNGPYPHTHPGIRPQIAPRVPPENSGTGNVYFGNGPYPSPHTNPGFRPPNAPRVPPANSGNGNVHFANGPYPSPHTNPGFRTPNPPRVPPENSGTGDVYFGNGPYPSPHTNPGFRTPNTPRVPPEHSGNGNMHFGNGPYPHTNPGFRTPNTPRVPLANSGHGNVHFGNGPYPSPHANPGFRPPNTPIENSVNGNVHFGNDPYPQPHTNPGFRMPNTPKDKSGNRCTPSHPQLNVPREQPGNGFMHPLASHPQMDCPRVPPEQSESTGYMACGNGFYPSSQTNSPREQFESNGNMPCGNRFYTNGPTNSPRVSPQQSVSHGFFHGPHGPKNLPAVRPEQSGPHGFYPNGQTNSSRVLPEQFGSNSNPCCNGFYSNGPTNLPRVPPEKSGSNAHMDCGNRFYPNGPTNSPRDQCNNSSKTLFKHLLNFCAKVQDFPKSSVLPQVGQCHAQGFNSYPQRHSLCDNSAFVMRKVPGHLTHYRPY
ncbi:PC-esterase domain-containing protein 1A-like isoform X3 [Engraulis encrasicolus]|uniref:PC-esterase domain-containing protein 1A-like isoform X3 n=1 Tax=Engraulis encrasicolus TaxID=184585 RepID=UPI002FD3C75C